MHDVACVMHVHSTYSDGTATPDEIAAAARAAGADAVFITDHDTLAARDAGWEGRHHGVLLVIGTEISPKGGHFLAFGLDREVRHDGLSEEEICTRVREAGALGFPAHPFSSGSAISRRIGRPHPWRSIDTCDVTGIELWSLVTECAERCSTVRELLAFLRDPEAAIDRPPARNLAEWDRLCRSRRVVAIGGLDAHQSGLRIGGRAFSPHPHDRLFRTLRTHVLTEAEPTADALLDALREGRCYLAVDSLADARGFRFWAEGESKVGMGGEAGAGQWTLHARLPAEAELTLLRDGRRIQRTHARSLERRVDGDGVFRVEAALRDRTWILSNPIYLRRHRSTGSPGGRRRSGGHLPRCAGCPEPYASLTTPGLQAARWSSVSLSTNTDESYWRSPWSKIDR